MTLPVRIPGATPGGGVTTPYSFFIDTVGHKPYIANVWVKPTTGWTNLLTGYAPNITLTFGGTTATFTAKTGIIEGWQQFEVGITPPMGSSTASLSLPAGFLYDDFKLFPAAANVKGFVYHPYTRKLIATLDENNYATLYEYDAEGNLIRTKRETEKGILTISESRNANPLRY
jgi:YD repeat-containing protein